VQGFPAGPGDRLGAEFKKIGPCNLKPATWNGFLNCCP
jgi:hypothetical protein